MTARFSFSFLILFLFLTSANAQKGHNLRIKLDNYEHKELVLGFHFGDKQYVKDTVEVGTDGYFTFKADTLLPCGVYLFVLKPDNAFIQILLSEDDQNFSMQTDVKGIVEKMKIKGSDENRIFYEYLGFLNKMRVDADTIKAKLGRTNGNAADSLRLVKESGELDNQVRKYQNDLITKNASTLTAKIIKSSLEPEIPEFEGKDAKEIQLKKYYWYRAHYFDNIDIADPCLLRSPVLHPKVDNYINKVVPQHPDSINLALDQVIEKLKNSQETYKFYLIHYLNTFAKSTIVGMDACYVHLAQRYYCNGGAPWVKEEDLEKICDNARRLEPILIGKIAPNIIVKDRNDKPMALWDVDADYTVLFFWAPDCSHCKKAAPHMVEFAKKFKDRGVKVFAVCTAVVTAKEDSNTPEKVKDTCWKALEEKEFSDFLFLNTYDPYIQSRYKMTYDVQSTPQIFVLDRKHEILMKRIGAEKLNEIMEDVMKFQEERKKSKGDK
ncbi:MAG: redoxin domain-containing protein [Saprospiraceae bacterium]|nr:redoxin domain-containing protein [Saprospiraceae bacterium]